LCLGSGRDYSITGTGFASWESFFLSWFIYTVAVSVFSVFAAATIMGTHKFFLGDEWKGDNERVLFYVVMTVLVGAFAVALVANAPEPDDDDAMRSSRPAEFAHAFPRGCSRRGMGRAANRMGGPSLRPCRHVKARSRDLADGYCESFDYQLTTTDFG
jgi:hypothetical protein